MSVQQIENLAIKKWKTPSLALPGLLQRPSLSTPELFATCLLWSHNTPDNFSSHIQLLRTLLERFPESLRAEALLNAVQHDSTKAANFLIQPTFSSLPGLAPLARSIAAQWSSIPRSDDLAIRFYRSLPDYGVPHEEVTWYIALALVARASYEQVEPLLIKLLSRVSSVEPVWLLIRVFQALRRPLQVQLDMLSRFLVQAPDDERAAHAWKLIGDMYEAPLETGSVMGESLLYFQRLQTLLEHVPEGRRPEIFFHLSHGDLERAAAILSRLPSPPAGLLPIVSIITTHWAQEPRHDDLALTFFRALPAFGIGQVEVFWLLARAYSARKMYIQAEQLLKQLGEIAPSPSPDIWWSLFSVLYALQRPPDILLQAFSHFIVSAPADPRGNRAWELIGTLYEGMSKEQHVSYDSSFFQTVGALFSQLSVQQRSDALTHLSHENDELSAHILSVLAPLALAGFAPSIARIVSLWSKAPRCDNLSLQFYYSLPAYGVSRPEAQTLLARAFVQRGMLARAEPLVEELVRLSATPDMIWLLASVYHAMQRSAPLQLETLQQFIACAPSDRRTALAWKRIGDLYGGDQLADGPEAVAAYLRAEQLGEQVPQLTAYFLGNWDAIPAFRTHSDYAFPTVAVVDLEVDPDPAAKSGERVFDFASAFPLCSSSEISSVAKPGERVFEVAAVRIKGNTVLRDYQSFIRRTFRPVKLADPSILEQAPEQEQVIGELRDFIGDAFVAGHNLCGFDAHHLRALGISIHKDQMIDTLTFARLLYPDQLRHNLATLCLALGIPGDEGQWHTALPDAYACARLLNALGDELLRRRGGLLKGIRALVAPNSPFDRVVLHPRNVPADPSLHWELDPAPSSINMLIFARQHQSDSPGMWKALQTERRDILVEHNDRDGVYASYLPSDEHIVVAVDSRARLERMLAFQRGMEDVYVLANVRSLLCPERLRRLIEQATESDYRLLLFCLYQASHNHDASTLYPMRLPDDDPLIKRLRKDLKLACCAAERHPHNSCPAFHALTAAIATHRVLMTTHEALLHLPTSPEADLLVIDDAEALQMHFAEYSAECIASDDLQARLVEKAEQDALVLLTNQLAVCAAFSGQQQAYHERVPLQSVAHAIRRQEETDKPSILEILEGASTYGEQVSRDIARLCADSQRESSRPQDIHAYWLDLWFAVTADNERALERWAICGLSINMQEAFQQRLWRPFKRHIICGTAITLGSSGASFLLRSFGLPNKVTILKDSREPTKICLPTPQMIPPGNFLHRRSWAMQAGAYLWKLAHSSEHSIVVSFNTATVSSALTLALERNRSLLKRQLLSTQLGWTTSKIAERLTEPNRSVIAVVSPRVRRSLIDEAVDVDVTGPLHFLNQRDPLVTAHMYAFAAMYPSEGPFNAYLLPQALLELKARLSPPARTHIVLDSGITAKIYRDEVLAALEECAEVEFIQQEAEETAQEGQDMRSFLEALTQELAARGLDSHALAQPDEDLYVFLHSLWNADEFNEFPQEGVASGRAITQKDIVRGVLDGKDQLVIAATGGGKSLCFQLPAILLAEEVPPKVTLVFSPLIALMSNQVQDLNRKGIFSAIVLNSTLSPAMRQEHLRGIKRGDYSIVYVAPEQIHSSGLRRALGEREVGLIAIDEAHCMSQWGHDFRTDYFAIRKWIDRQICRGLPRQFPILALTATARKGYTDAEGRGRSDEASTVQDIIGKLGLQMTVNEVVMASPQREELEFEVSEIVPGPLHCFKCRGELEAKAGEAKCPGCGERRRIPESEIRQAVQRAKCDQLLQLLTFPGPDGLYERWNRPPGKRQRGLVYCAYRRTTEEVTAILAERIPGLRVHAYHAGMDMATREEVLRRFTSDEDEGLDLVVATNAFGMGIDVRRLGFVLHFDMPGTLEAYYQEAGRAGRDREFKNRGEHARCILLYHPYDKEMQRYLSRRNIITRYHIEDVYQVLSALREDARTGEEQHNSDLAEEFLVTEQEIAVCASVDEDIVTTILYYLEYHARVHGQPLLERGETANRVWRLRLETDSQERIAQLPAGSSSWPLLRLFVVEGDFHLSGYTATTVSAGELAACLGWGMPKLEAELLNLVRRHILSYESNGRICWAYSSQHAFNILQLLEHDIRTLLNEVDKRGRKALQRGEMVSVDLHAIAAQCGLQALPVPQLAHFLFALSREDARPRRIFEHFARAIRRPQPGYYEFRLAESGEQTGRMLREIFDQLRQTVKRLVEQQVSSEWQKFDIFALEPAFDERQHFHRQLLLLHTLGLVKYIGDPAMGLAIRVTFKQGTVTKDQLEIDLSTLRLKETYEKYKLKLMVAYATTGEPKKRPQQFTAYFFGEQPLVERIEKHLRDDLTRDQLEVTHFIRGCHLIEGMAGCGKTTTLVEAIKQLVYVEHVPLDRIMVTAHYNSAVGRIAKDLEVLQEDGSVVLVTTINKLGERLFKQHRLLLRRGDGRPYYAKEPQLLTGSLQEKKDKELRLVSNALSHVYDGTWPMEIWPFDLEEKPKPKGTYRRNAATEEMYWDTINIFRQRGLFPTQNLRKEDIVSVIGEVSKDDPDNTADRYAVYLTYLWLMGEEGNFYTFDDQIIFALAILQENPQIVEEYRHFFEYIIVDELQDFTPAQLALFLKLCHVNPNILAFGDRDQEIRPKQTQAKTVFEKLQQMDSCGSNRLHSFTTNFRSTQEILDLISYVRNYKVSEDAKRRVLTAARGSSGNKPAFVYVHPASADLRNRKEQYNQHEILEAMADAALGQMSRLSEAESGRVAFILARSNAEWVNSLEKILINRGISFSIMNSNTIYQLPHVEHVLLYLRLIDDPHRDDDVASLLRYCVVPYLDYDQIQALKGIAKLERRALIELLNDPEVLNRVQLREGQWEALQKHLALLTVFSPESTVRDVAEALRGIPEGPIAVYGEDEQKRGEIEEVLKELANMTIKDALATIHRHILYLDKHRSNTSLILTTVDSAKSEEFDSVFLLCADFLGRDWYKPRLYVSISRARERLFLLINAQLFQASDNSLLSSIPHQLYDEVHWPDGGDSDTFREKIAYDWSPF